MSDTSEKNYRLISIFGSPLIYFFPIGIAMLLLLIAAAGHFVTGAFVSGWYCLLFVAIVYAAGTLWGALGVLFEVLEEHKYKADEQKDYEKYWRKFSQWRSKFVEQLGFYEASGGRKLRDMKKLSERMEALLVDHAAWQQGRGPKMKTGQVASDLQLMAYELEIACMAMEPAKAKAKVMG